ncbi:hypothetical protein ABIB90_007975 [Bradyrhizobium sp. JR4.1]|uniref:hypothetical protein n=1 Tax=Bradyrhizobium sp. JR4.1 TaxID=3156372 RepID=UPI00339AB3BE
MAKHPRTKINLISSFASRPDGLPKQSAQGHGMEACPDAADRQAVQDAADCQVEKGNVTRKNGKIASKSGHFTTYCMTAHHSTTAVADATTHTAGRNSYPSMHKPNDAENTS